MSTDTRPDASDRRASRRPATRRFRRRWLAAVLVLALVTIAAAAVGSTQGPRLRDVSYSASDLVSRPGQRVILTTNQAVEGVRARSVRVTPAAAHTVTSSGNTVAVAFDGPLDYDRDYRITVSGVRAPGQSAASTLSTTIRTGSTDVLTLLPGGSDANGSGTDGAGAQDRIVRRPLDGSGDTVVYRASGITGYALLARSLVVSRDDADRHSHVDIVPLTAAGVEDRSSPIEHLTLPSATARVTALHAADDGSSFGFVSADTSSGRSTRVGLYTVDIAGTHLPVPVLPDGTVGEDRDATPITVSQWGYVPRTGSALVRTGDDRLLLVSMTGATKPVELGSAVYLHGFVGTGTTAIVESGRGVRVLDLSDGRTTSLQAAPQASDAAYAGRIAGLTASSYLRVVGEYRADGSLDASIVRVAGSRATTLAVPLPRDASVTAVCPSPNGQFAAVLTRTASDSTVLVVDASSGALEASTAGTDADWCGALPSGDDVA